MADISRRAVLAGIGVGSLALGLAACGVPSQSPSPLGSPKRGGVLRIGMTGGASYDSLDSFNATTPPDYARIVNLFEPLVTMNSEGKPQLALASELTPDATAQNWTLRLRPDVTFHNGKDVTADDVIYTLQGILNPDAPGAAAAAIELIDAANLKKIDPLTVQIPCLAPFATLEQALSIITFSGLVPVDFDPANPVGAGPFKLKSFTPGQRSEFVRFDDYWGDPAWVDSLIIENFSDETSQLNALNGGDVDGITLLSAASYAAVSASRNQVSVSPGGGWNPFFMRTDVAPFDDVRVRQAIRLGVDREEMNELVFGGLGTIGNDIPGIWAPEYSTSIPQRSVDIEQARSLLREAGHETLEVELTVADLAQGVSASAQVLAQQLERIGVTVKINTVTTTAYYENFLQWPFAVSYWYYDMYLPTVALSSIPTAPWNETHFVNDEHYALYQQALATPDEAARAEICHEMQLIEHEEGGYIIPNFAPVIDGFGPNVGGVVESKTGASFNGYDFKSMWLA